MDEYTKNFILSCNKSQLNEVVKSVALGKEFLDEDRNKKFYIEILKMSEDEYEKDKLKKYKFYEELNELIKERNQELNS